MKLADLFVCVCVGDKQVGGNPTKRLKLMLQRRGKRYSCVRSSKQGVYLPQKRLKLSVKC
eukprot:1370936-Prorocentrum_lima.AAC.1